MKHSTAEQPAPVEIKTVETETFRMQYFSFGSGAKPLVILPGSSVKSVMLSADAVAAGYACFAQAYTVYVFDCREELPEGYTTQQMAADTAAAMQQLGLERADVFGCSLGGMIAQYLAIDYPGLVRKMALGSTTARGYGLCFEQWCRLADSGDTAALNRSVFDKVYSPAYYARYRDIFAALENEGTPEELRRFSIMIRACRTVDSYDRLERIACPVLVIGAWGDRTIAPQGSIELARKLNCDLFMYAGFGHAVYDEAPDYRARLLAFFGN